LLRCGGDLHGRTLFSLARFMRKLTAILILVLVGRGSAHASPTKIHPDPTPSVSTFNAPIPAGEPRRSGQLPDRDLDHHNCRSLRVRPVPAATSTTIVLYDMSATSQGDTTNSSGVLLNRVRRTVSRSWGYAVLRLFQRSSLMMPALPRRHPSI